MNFAVNAASPESERGREVRVASRAQIEFARLGGDNVLAAFAFPNSRPPAPVTIPCSAFTAEDVRASRLVFAPLHLLLLHSLLHKGLLRIRYKIRVQPRVPHFLDGLIRLRRRRALTAIFPRLSGPIVVSPFLHERPLPRLEGWRRCGWAGTGREPEAALALRRSWTTSL